MVRILLTLDDKTAEIITKLANTYKLPRGTIIKLLLQSLLQKEQIIKIDLEK